MKTTLIFIAFLFAGNVRAQSDSQVRRIVFEQRIAELEAKELEDTLGMAKAIHFAFVDSARDAQIVEGQHKFKKWRTDPRYDAFCDSAWASIPNSKDVPLLLWYDASGRAETFLRKFHEEQAVIDALKQKE